MNEIFLSYSSKDRARVQPLRDALTDRGFSVFWDQEVPANSDWDTWIRQHLNESKCVIVTWSAHSILSNNVRHEAVIARQQNKIVPVMLDAITADQFPMGLYTVQAVNLCAWTGDTDSSDWQNVLREVESRLTPPWIRRTIDALEAELVSERARRESAERRDRTLREQIAKEADARQKLQADHSQLLESVEHWKKLADAADGERGVRVAEVRTHLEQSEQERRETSQSLLKARQEIDELTRALTDLRGRQPLAPAAPAVDVSTIARPSVPAVSTDTTSDDRWKEWQNSEKPTNRYLVLLVGVVIALLVIGFALGGAGR